MERKERIRLEQERRDAEYACAVEEFKEYLPQKQRRIVECMKAVSEITDWTFLWLWDDTPYQEWFEKVFKILPSSLRKKVLNKIREGGDDYAIYGNESIF